MDRDTPGLDRVGEAGVLEHHDASPVVTYVPAAIATASQPSFVPSLNVSRQAATTASMSGARYEWGVPVKEREALAPARGQEVGRRDYEGPPR